MLFFRFVIAVLYGIYLLKDNHRNTKARCEICSKFGKRLANSAIYSLKRFPITRRMLTGL